MALFRSSKQKFPTLVIDIGGGSVGAAVISRGPKPFIHFATREIIRTESDTAESRTEDLTKKALENVLHKVGGELGRELGHVGGTVDDIIAIISSPWYFSKTSTVHTEHDTPVPYKKFLFNDLLLAEEKIYEESLSHDPTISRLRDHLEFVDRAIIETKLNGYSTDNPEAHSARSLDIGFFMSLMSRDVKAAFSGIIEKQYHREPRYFCLPLVVFGAMRDLRPGLRDYLFIDVGALVTDITVVKGGSIFGTASFPLGRNFLLKEMSVAFSVEENVALSFATLYVDGKIEPSLFLKMGKVIEEVESKWRSGLHAALMHYAKDIFVPLTAYLSVDYDFLSFFKTFAEHERVGQVDPSDEALDVVPLTKEIVREHCEYQSQQFADPILSIGSAYINKIEAR
ncbi:MAG: hypothetical protein Q7S15_02285 [bacterium]|nr:hypothetical protein [bacterium]